MTATPRLGLIRHPAVSVPAGLCYGRSEVALRPGWEPWCDSLAVDAAALRPARVLSSPSRRCAEPAARLAASLGTEVLLDPRLAELDFGEWDGRFWSDIPRAALDDWAADPAGFRFPGGESIAELVERVTAVADGPLRQEGTLVVAHGGPLRLLLRRLVGLRPDPTAPTPEPGSLTILALA